MAAHCPFRGPAGPHRFETMPHGSGPLPQGKGSCTPSLGQWGMMLGNRARVSRSSMATTSFLTTKRMRWRSSVPAAATVALSAKAVRPVGRLRKPASGAEGRQSWSKGHTDDCWNRQRNQLGQCTQRLSSDKTLVSRHIAFIACVHRCVLPGVPSSQFQSTAPAPVPVALAE